MDNEMMSDASQDEPSASPSRQAVSQGQQMKIDSRMAALTASNQRQIGQDLGENSFDTGIPNFKIPVRKE